MGDWEPYLWWPPRRTHGGLLEVALRWDCDPAVLDALVEGEEVRLVLRQAPLARAFFEDLAAWPGLARVRAIRLDGRPETRRDALAPLARSPHLGGLRALDVGDYVDVDADVLSDVARAAPGVDAFWAGGAMRRADPLAKGIAGGPWRLRNLVLRGCGAKGAEALVPVSAALVALDLDGAGGALGDAGVAALARFGTRALRSLSLSAVRVRDLSPLAASELLATVEDLDLSFNDDGAAALTGSPHLRALRRLTLNGSDVDAVALCARIPAIERLNLAHTGAGDAAAIALAELPALEALSLAGGRVGPTGARALLEGAAALRDLNLSSCRLGDAGAIAIASCPSASRLESLRLDRCDVGAPGGRAIAASPHLEGLRHLDLERNPLGASRPLLHARFGDRALLDERPD